MRRGEIEGLLLLTATVAVILGWAAVVADEDVIPGDRSRIETWFKDYVGGGGEISHNQTAVVITVRKDGRGRFETISEALNSVPVNNRRRVVIDIGPGNYTEKIMIDRDKPFVTLYGDPTDMPVLVFDGTAARYTTMGSATLTVEALHFTAVNLVVVNSAPRPDGIRKGAQASALRVSGDSAAFYNCSFHGFQDTVVDDMGRHFFKDCYIEGTMDFICGSGQSLYLNTELRVIPGEEMAFITAQARKKATDADGFVFVHCRITGAGETAYLGRPWYPYARVVYAFTEMSAAVNPAGWSLITDKRAVSTTFFGEYQNKGPGANLSGRPPCVKNMSDTEARPFITLDFIGASEWLLPPPHLPLSH